MIPHERREDVKKQVRRMRGLRGFPHEYQEAVTEIVEALMAAASLDQAQQFITDWLHVSAEAPTPADIYKAMRSETPRPPEPVTYTRCEKCGDTGFMRVTRGSYEGAAACDCRRKPQ